MTEDQQDLLEMARENLAVARLLVGGRFFGIAASRAYYVMFYVAEAFLEGEEMSFSKHSAVIAAFGREFVHKGKVPVEFHRFLTETQELRFTGDYGAPHAVSEEQARVAVDRAGQFLELAKRLIGPLPPEAGSGK
jgi:uncharacterized protein (UPF0332 family)